ncbi:preprotein translocase subunit SecE [Lederbergia ruris]|uniref:Protein translocase subunit SecE n=1 Tax=Lederbergia ruris TaxID=217495 RepID=A0ABQ4KNH6_9BACI|nr:preprotein translocase subunit SecE [Lederbergia ruris]GIN58933.1 protein translocase subunit SecE [Lederbergia ruris]
MSSVMQFFRNVRSEMRKVSWPRRKELTSYTITVVTTVALLALFFAGVDYIISYFMRFIIGN